MRIHLLLIGIISTLTLSCASPSKVDQVEARFSREILLLKSCAHNYLEHLNGDKPLPREAHQITDHPLILSASVLGHKQDRGLHIGTYSVIKDEFSYTGDPTDEQPVVRKGIATLSNGSSQNIYSYRAIANDHTGKRRTIQLVLLEEAISED